MIWAIRAGVLVAMVALAVLALRPGDVPPTPEAAPTVVVTRGALAASTPRPAPPEIVVSRLTRQTPTPRATQAAAAPNVAAVEFGYLPSELSVPPGTTVTFRNSGAEGHDVYGGGPDGTWWSGPLAPTETYRRQFAHPGSYDYLCSFHAEMRGTIIVVP